MKNTRRLLLATSVPVILGFGTLTALAAPGTGWGNRQAERPEMSEDCPRPMHPRLDVEGAAEQLGVSEAALLSALGLPEDFPPAEPPAERPPRPDFTAAAEQLGVTEEALLEALGVPFGPGGGPRDGLGGGRGDRPGRGAGQGFGQGSGQGSGQRNQQQ